MVSLVVPGVGEGREMLSGAVAWGPDCTARRSRASTSRKPRRTRRSTVLSRRDGDVDDAAEGRRERWRERLRERDPESGEADREEELS